MIFLQSSTVMPGWITPPQTWAVVQCELGSWRMTWCAWALKRNAFVLLLLVRISERLTPIKYSAHYMKPSQYSDIAAINYIQYIYKTQTCMCIHRYYIYYMVKHANFDLCEYKSNGVLKNKDSAFLCLNLIKAAIIRDIHYIKYFNTKLIHACASMQNIQLSC